MSLVIAELLQIALQGAIILLMAQGYWLFLAAHLPLAALAGYCGTTATLIAANLHVALTRGKGHAN